MSAPKPKPQPLTVCQASIGDGECIHAQCPSTVKGDRLFGTCPLPMHERDERERARRAKGNQ